MHSYSSIKNLVFSTLDLNPHSTLQSIADGLAIDRHTVTRAIHATTGISFRQLRQSVILNKARSLLFDGGTRSIKELSYTAGFGSPRSFQRTIVRAFRVSPSEFRRWKRSPIVDLISLIHCGYLVKCSEVASNVLNIRVQVGAGDSFRFEPGQSIGLIVGVDGKFVLRLYSLASSPDALPTEGFELCVGIVRNGKVTSWLQGLHPGDALTFLGPFGLFGLRRPLDSVLTFVASGTGIAPIRSMLRFLRQEDLRNVQPWLILGAQKEELIPYKEEFEQMARSDGNFRFMPVLSSPQHSWAGLRGRVQDHLAEALKQRPSSRVYACGSLEMIQSVEKTIDQSGCSRDQLVVGADT
jgi:NAD(P)H-flavin reductase/AraC-like DNA-binding protein